MNYYQLTPSDLMLAELEEDSSFEESVEGHLSENCQEGSDNQMRNISHLIKTEEEEEEEEDSAKHPPKCNQTDETSEVDDDDDPNWFMVQPVRRRKDQNETNNSSSSPSKTLKAWIYHCGFLNDLIQNIRRVVAVSQKSIKRYIRGRRMWS